MTTVFKNPSERDVAKAIHAFVRRPLSPRFDGDGKPSLIDCLYVARDIIDSLLPGKRWRHKKRGTTYAAVYPAAEVQASGRPLVEGDLVTVYVGEDGKAWVRLQAEFEDGRYEPIDET